MVRCQFASSTNCDGRRHKGCRDHKIFLYYMEKNKDLISISKRDQKQTNKQKQINFRYLLHSLNQMHWSHKQRWSRFSDFIYRNIKSQHQKGYFFITTTFYNMNHKICKQKNLTSRSSVDSKLQLQVRHGLCSMLHGLASVLNLNC